MEAGNPVVIPNAEGGRTTPSIVGYSDDIKVGNPAKRQSVVNSEKTIYSIKRFMGKKYSDCSKELKGISYKVEKGTNDNPVVKIGNKKYTPQEISATVLQKMKKTAEDYLGTEIKRAVITVPAYFGDAERTATKEAGEIAGFVVERIINEPTAAALAYGLDKKHKDMKVAVFDLGGGTFDISILDLGGGVFEVKSTNGDVHLGGDDWDRMIVDWLAEEFMKDYPNVDLRKDSQAHQRLREAAEKAKIELSSSIETEINLPYIIPIDNIPQHLIKKLSRSKFEQLTEDLLKRVKGPCEKALSDAKITKNEIDEVILVGGSTRMVAVQNLVKDIFGKEPNKSVNPDEAVAVGAAIQGAIISGEITDVLLLDVIPISLGIETMGNVFTKLIESNTTIPTKKTQVFSTASDNQPAVEIHVLQGERPMAMHNKTLGRFHLDGIMPAPRGVPQIEVSFDVNANGILTVEAIDKATGKKQHIRIEGSSNLSDDEKERMIREAKENEEKDKKEKEIADKLNSADAMIFQTRKQMKDLADKLTEDDKSKLEEAVKSLEEVYKSKDVDNIESNMAKINDIWSEISTRLYKETQSDEFGSDPNVSDSKTEDVKYEEVK